MSADECNEENNYLLENIESYSAKNLVVLYKSVVDQLKDLKIEYEEF